MREIGCGTGGAALHFACDVAEVTATDITREMIAVAEQKRMETLAANAVVQSHSSIVRLAPTSFGFR